MKLKRLDYCIVYCADGDDDDTVDIHALMVKRARVCKEGIINSKQPNGTAKDVLAKTDVWAILGRIYFLNEERTRYVSVGFYPSDNYQVLVEFGGPRIVPIRLAEHYFRTLMEALPALCDAMQCGELYTRKDGAFRIGPSGPIPVLDCITANSVSVLRLGICAIC